MALLSIDELNTPNVEVEPPERYFSRMAISKEQKEERVDTANEIMDVLLFFFALLAIEMQENNPDYDMVLRKFRIRFADVVASHSRMDDHQNAYVDDFTQNQFDVTRRHMEAVGVGVDGQTDAGWWSSPDRATAIGEDAANSILNYEELQDAIDNGYTKKMWVTERDNRVRKTHMQVDGRTIPIKEYFVVGNAAMMMPHDPECLDEREIVNCRCTLKFIGKHGNRKTKNKEYTQSDISDKIESQRNYAKPIEELTNVPFGGYGSDITPDMIYANMRTSIVGRDAIEYYENINANINFKSGIGDKGQRADQLGYNVNIYMGIIPSARVGAQSLIHEYVHMRYGIGGCQLAEAICMAFEKMHIVGRDWITREEWEYVSQLAKDNYDEQWIKGGYGDYGQFGDFEKFDFIRG